MIVSQHLVLTRGDTRDITLTMPAGTLLTSAQSVRFTARDDDDDVVWEQTITPSSDTVAVASIAVADWTTWDDASEPRVLHFDFQVVDAGGDVHTPALGTITVVPDQSR